MRTKVVSKILVQKNLTKLQAKVVKLWILVVNIKAGNNNCDDQLTTADVNNYFEDQVWKSVENEKFEQKLKPKVVNKNIEQNMNKTCDKQL